MSDSSNDPTNDDLQALWNDQPDNLSISNMKELTMSLQQDHHKEQRRLLFLNMQEVIPAVGLFLWCGWKGLQADTRAWAWFVAALVTLGVALFLVASSLRQRQLEQAFDATTRGELERSLSQVKHRAQLYRSVGWWYLLPCAFAIVLILFAEGVDFAATGVLVYLAVAVAFFAVLYYLNRKIGREKYEPKVAHFTDLIAQLGAD